MKNKFCIIKKMYLSFLAFAFIQCSTDEQEDLVSSSATTELETTKPENEQENNIENINLSSHYDASYDEEGFHDHPSHADKDHKHEDNAKKDHHHEDSAKKDHNHHNLSHNDHQHKELEEENKNLHDTIMHLIERLDARDREEHESECGELFSIVQNVNLYERFIDEMIEDDEMEEEYDMEKEHDMAEEHDMDHKEEKKNKDLPISDYTLMPIKSYFKDFYPDYELILIGEEGLSCGCDTFHEHLVDDLFIHIKKGEAIYHYLPIDIKRRVDYVNEITMDKEQRWNQKDNGGERCPWLGLHTLGLIKKDKKMIAELNECGFGSNSWNGLDIFFHEPTEF